MNGANVERLPDWTAKPGGVKDQQSCKSGADVACCFCR